MLEDKGIIMKKIYNLTIASLLALAFAGCGGGVMTPDASPALKLDVKTTCNVKANGIEKVLATAKMYNPIAKKKEIEFHRFGVKASQYISKTEAAIKKGEKRVSLVGKKKKVYKMSVEKAASRACTFAIRALQVDHESQTSWRLAVPGDGFKY